MKKKTKMTTSQFQWKILRFIIIAYIVVFVVAGVIKIYVKEEKDIASKIGSAEPYSISIKDAMNVNIYSITLYTDYLKNQNFESAYQMLTSEYQAIVSYEDFLKSLEGIDFETLRMENVKMKAEGTYVADITYERNGEKKETKYLIYANSYNPQQMRLSPNKFIYSYKDLKFEKDQIELNLQQCVIYTDSIKMSVVIKNKSMLQTMEFINLGLGYGNTVNKQDDIELILEPGEEKVIEIEYDVNYYVPNNIKLKRVLDGETIRTYTFYFEEEKNKSN